jgi:hypothetical protein
MGIAVPKTAGIIVSNAQCKIAHNSDGRVVVTHRLGLVVGGLLLIGCLFGLMASPTTHPILFLASIVSVFGGGGLFYIGGYVDGCTAPIRHESKRLDLMLRTWRLLAVGCLDIVIAGVIAAIVTPPDLFSMLIAQGLLVVVLGIVYVVGLRNGRSQTSVSRQ